MVCKLGQETEYGHDVECEDAGLGEFSGKNTERMRLGTRLGSGLGSGLGRGL